MRIGRKLSQKKASQESSLGKTPTTRRARRLQTKAGEVRLKIPKLRQQTFETAIIERYRRRESSVAITVLSQCRAPLVRHRKIVYSAMGLVSQMSKFTTDLILLRIFEYGILWVGPEANRYKGAGSAKRPRFKRELLRCA